MELLWALAASAPALVIEANFRPHSEYERAKLSGLAAQPVEVHCACPPELAVKRYNARTTHPVYVMSTLQIEAMAEYDRPVGIGALVTVDTTVPVNVRAVLLLGKFPAPVHGHREQCAAQALPRAAGTGA